MLEKLKINKDAIKKIFIPVGVVLIAILFSYFYFYPKYFQSNQKSDANQNSGVPEYVQDRLKEIYGENAKIATTEEEKEEMKKDKNSLGVLSIPLKSIPNSLLVTQEPWMLSMDVYDKQLTELENKQREDFESKNGEARYTAIFNRDDLYSELISHLEDFVESAKEDRAYFIDNKQKRLDFLSSLNERIANYGYSGVFTEDNVAEIRNNSNAIINLIDDIVRMADLLIKVKEGTIEQIKNKDALMVLYSADDEDTVSLVLSWHIDGYQNLQKKGAEIFDKLKSQLPAE